jgi:hypothetical protein
MRETVQSEGMVGFSAIAALALFVGWRLLVWIKNAPLSPDPWNRAIDQTVHQPDAVPICHHCLTPASPTGWFCECCGCAVGPYNNYMPYLYIFSQGEVLRNGVTERIQINALTVGGYLLISLSGYVVFAPLYWFFLFRNLRQNQAVPVDESMP